MKVIRKLLGSFSFQRAYMDCITAHTSIPYQKSNRQSNTPGLSFTWLQGFHFCLWNITISRIAVDLLQQTHGVGDQGQLLVRMYPNKCTMGYKGLLRMKEDRWMDRDKFNLYAIFPSQLRQRTYTMKQSCFRHDWYNYTPAGWRDSIPGKHRQKSIEETGKQWWNLMNYRMFVA